ncbi:hypothetical protein OE749_06380 [Aestuariibacter sp. AA17]|uniref:Uncharacterized protein n=1 Tax=Fluctibacter corallii TaxID=2984329 RepID=A0ABT3A6L0_9ALTE|nr:hypothetical protein [Aestuariibacter sp. AA17]MCV2884316.1 hypothetical protein [Aestuariibacter sp. AA17]
MEYIKYDETHLIIGGLSESASTAILYFEVDIKEYLQDEIYSTVLVPLPIGRRGQRPPE